MFLQCYMNTFWQKNSTLRVYLYLWWKLTFLFQYYTSLCTKGVGGIIECLSNHESLDHTTDMRTPPGPATFFSGDWSWNIFYGHSLPSADSRRAVVSFLRLIMKYCLRSFSPFRWFKKGSCQFLEIDHEILSTVILSLPLIQEGQLSVSGKRVSTSTG